MWRKDYEYNFSRFLNRNNRAKMNRNSSKRAELNPVQNIQPHRSKFGTNFFRFSLNGFPNFGTNYSEILTVVNCPTYTRISKEPS